MADISFKLVRETPFSYQCNQCKKCCYEKWIPLNPYDLIRLARGLGLSTGEFIAKHPTEGVRLNRRELERVPVPTKRNML